MASRGCSHFQIPGASKCECKSTRICVARDSGRNLRRICVGVIFRCSAVVSFRSCVVAVNRSLDERVYLFNFDKEMGMTRLIIRSFLAAITVLAARAAPATAQQRNQAIAGKWSLVIQSVEGAAPRSLDLSVEQDSIVTGSVGSPMGALPIGTGRFVGDRLLIEFTMGGSIGVTYDLRVRGDTLRGFYKQPGYLGDVLGVRGDRDVKFPPKDPAKPSR